MQSSNTVNNLRGIICGYTERINAKNKINKIAITKF